MFSLDELRSFRAFADHLNFTRAAEELHISQPALHMKIAELSRQLQLALYVKRGRRLELTPKGEELALFAREMADRLDEFGERFLDRAPGPVALAAGQGAYLYLLGPALRRYLKTAPLQLLTADREGCLEAVRSGAAHLGVAVLEERPGSLLSQPVAHIPMAVAMPSRHRLARRDSLQLADLEGMPLIVSPPGRPLRRALGAALEAAGVRWLPAVETQGWELMLHFVSLGLGLAVVNSFCQAPRGVVLRPLEGLPSVTYSLFWRPGYLRADAEALKTLIGAMDARPGAA